MAASITGAIVTEDITRVEVLRTIRGIEIDVGSTTGELDDMELVIIEGMTMVFMAVGITSEVIIPADGIIIAAVTVDMRGINTIPS
jgi:hypothetical protein